MRAEGPAIDDWSALGMAITFTIWCCLVRVLLHFVLDPQQASWPAVIIIGLMLVMVLRARMLSWLGSRPPTPRCLRFTALQSRGSSERRLQA